MTKKHVAKYTRTTRTLKHDFNNFYELKAAQGKNKIEIWTKLGTKE